MDNVGFDSTCFYNNATSSTKKLYEICKWNEIDNVAIEYHDLQETIIRITYRELFAAKTMLSDLLKFIKNFEFIGIDFDIPAYCVTSLMLGILTNKHSFVNVPSDLTERTNLKTALRIRYLFSKQIPVDGNVLNEFKIHNESIYFVELKHVQKQDSLDVEPDYYAYAITTSGSTGTPKIVKVPHSCIVPNILDLNKILTVNASDKIAQFTDLTFDPSIIEIFLALSNAATLFMTSKSLKNNLNRLLEEAYSSQITVLQMTPSVFLYSWTVERIRNTILSNNTSLRILLLGGEPLPKLELLREVKHPCNNTKIYNIYGITEVSCWASINEITTNSQLNAQYLGEVLSQTMFQVKDERGNVVTNGTGFLYIGSNSRICAINDEVIESLLPPVFRDTGDMVRIDENGRIFYKGRKNNIIKRFGNKVDLTKLEEFALQLNFVKSCYALWDESCHKLHLCLTTKKEITDYSNANSQVTEHLRKLGPLDRPDEIHFFRKLEYTSNGKVAVNFLKKHIQKKTRGRNLSHINFEKIEETFNRIWEDNLAYRDDGFINLGGTSIVALQISNAMSQRVRIEFPELIGMLLNNATPGECLCYIKTIVLNDHRDNAISFECHSYSSREIAIINNSKAHSKCVDAKDEDSNLFQNCTFKWNKCKGQVHSDSAIRNQQSDVEENVISRIEMLGMYDLQKCVDASPTIFHYSDGETYATVGSHSGFVSTFQLGNDNCIATFRTKLPDRIEASVLILDNFKGVVGCYDGNVYCLHLKTGVIIWKYQTGDVVKCSAISCKEREKLFVGSYDRHVYCLSATDGAEIWRVRIGNGGISASGCLHAPSNSVLFGTLDGFCAAIDQSSGEITWKRKVADPIFVAPLTLNAGLVLVCSVTGVLCCFDIRVNIQMWSLKINGNVFSYILKTSDTITGCESIVIASQNKNVYCFQSTDSNFKTEPTLKYVLNLHSSIFATPWYERNVLYIACTDGTLYIYNSVRNRLIKTEPFPGEVFSSPVVNDGILIVGCRDNNVYILKLI